VARSIDVADAVDQGEGCSVTGVVSGVLVAHVETQANGVAVAANSAGAAGTAIKCGVVLGTGMNPDVNAGVAVEAV
jgi:hypothetical protein